MRRHESQSETGAIVDCFESMGSFFRNLLKSNNQSSEKGGKNNSSKWLFMFKKTPEQSEQITNIFGQEDNQGRLRTSNSASSMGSAALSDKSLAGENILLLPKLKKINFSVPRYIPPNEWIRSQLFEVTHLISCFIDLISAKNSSSVKNLELQLEQIVLLVDDQKSDFKQIFICAFELINSIYKHEINLLMELKLESHLNSLTCQLIELCSQLSGSSYLEVIDSLKTLEIMIDFSAHKRALGQLESQSISRAESNIVG